MAKISIMTMVFGGELERGDLTDAGLLAALEATGYDGVELNAGRLLSAASRVDACETYLADSRLEVTCLDVGCNLIGADQAARDEGIAALRAGLELAARLGSPISLAAGSRLSGEISPEDGRRMTADGLEACMAEARELGVTVAIEDFGVAPTLQCAAADCLEILDAVPGLAFVFDTGNFYFAGEDPERNMERLAGRTRHVHLKDWIKSETPQIADVSGAPLGQGIIPNEALVRRFVEAGLVDSFSVELGAPGDRLEAARADLETVRGWLRE